MIEKSLLGWRFYFTLKLFKLILVNTAAWGQNICQHIRHNSLAGAQPLFSDTLTTVLPCDPSLQPHISQFKLRLKYFHLSHNSDFLSLPFSTNPNKHTTNLFAEFLVIVGCIQSKLTLNAIPLKPRPQTRIIALGSHLQVTLQLSHQHWHNGTCFL